MLISIRASQSRPATFGVIRDSVLRPLLFLMHIDDTLSVINYGASFLFANNVEVVYTLAPNVVNFITDTSSKDLHSIGYWRSKLAMKYSAEKCEPIAHRCAVSPGTLSINSIPVAIRNLIIDLGLHYSDKFNLSEHANFQTAKTKNCTDLAFRYMCLLEICLSDYDTHLRPILD